jgi:predicted nuclease of restriction endonuclease-like (RecB) superfamily
MKRVPANPDRLLLDEIRGLIEQARLHVAQTANSTLTMLHWKLGERILREVLQGQRAQYGEEILPTLSAKLVPDYGQGFSARNLARMVKFAEAFTDENIVVSLSRELSWSHFVEILPLKKPLEREFYAEMCRIERWSVRTLRERIGGQLYLRTALSKKPEALVDAELKKLRAGGQMTPDLVFRDPYMLDFLGLSDGYSERDLEAAILRDMERFLLELGAGFSFVARQKRVSVGADDFLSRSAVLPPAFAAAGGRGTETGEVSARPQGPDGTVSALVGQVRTGRRRGVAHRPDSVRRSRYRAGGTARSGQRQYPGGGIPGQDSGHETVAGAIAPHRAKST